MRHHLFNIPLTVYIITEIKTLCKFDIAGQDLSIGNWWHTNYSYSLFRELSICIHNKDSS